MFKKPKHIANFLSAQKQLPPLLLALPRLTSAAHKYAKK
jgi:hypothetical protein